MDEENPFPIAESSPAMRGEAQSEPRAIRRADRAKFPFAETNVGYSFAVPLSFNENALRVRVTRENQRGKKQFRVIKWETCYEVGCVKGWEGEPEPATGIVPRETPAADIVFDPANVPMPKDDS